MPKKAILVVAPGILGALVLAWAAFAARPEEGTAKAGPSRPAPARREGAPPATAAPREAVTSRPAAATPAAIAPENAAIQARVRVLEERLLELEAKRDGIAAANRELEKQVTEKWAEASARTTAEWRVKSWETLIALSESQKQSLVDLCTKWGREDAGRPAGRDAWLAREAELRPRLTVEQAAKLSENAAAQSGRMWSSMGRSLGGMVGATKDEQVRIQQTLGDLRLPADMLFPEAHGGDWPGLLRDASARARPLLTPEQTARLEKFGGNK